MDVQTVITLIAASLNRDIIICWVGGIPDSGSMDQQATPNYAQGEIYYHQKCLCLAPSPLSPSLPPESPPEPPPEPPSSPPPRIDACGPGLFHNITSGNCEIEPDPELEDCQLQRDTETTTALRNRRQASEEVVQADFDKWLDMHPEWKATVDLDDDHRQLFEGLYHHVNQEFVAKRRDA